MFEKSGKTVAKYRIQTIGAIRSSVIFAVALGFGKQWIVYPAIDLCPGVCIIVALLGICADINFFISDGFCKICKSRCISNAVALSIDEMIVGVYTWPIFTMCSNIS